MNKKEQEKMIKLVGSELASEVFAKLDQLAKDADKRGIEKKEAGQFDIFKQLGFSDLERQRHAQRELERVQQLVSDFAMLAQEQLATGDTDLTPLISELSDYLMVGESKNELAKMLKARSIINTEGPFAKFKNKEKSNQSPFVAAIRDANRTPGIMSDVVKSNEAWEKSSSPDLGDVLRNRIKAIRLVQLQNQNDNFNKLH